MNWYYHTTITCPECQRRYKIEYQKTIWRDHCLIACACGKDIFSESGAAFYHAVPVGHSDEAEVRK